MIAIPYGKGHLDVAFPYNGLLTSRVDELKSDRTGRELVEEAMASPIGTPGLAALAAGKKRCTIIISDHTRPVPSRDILPPMLAQLRQGNPEIRVTLLVATGFHRLTTTTELEAKLGKEIAGSEKIVVHDAFDPESNVQIGVLPSGAPLVIDRTAVDTDLLIAEGFIEPHFFAGFSGLPNGKGVQEARLRHGLPQGDQGVLYEAESRRQDRGRYGLSGSRHRRDHRRQPA